ncbi:MAG: nucleotide sugar dehydrogenase [Dermatophilaceae bacterium]
MGKRCVVIGQGYVGLPMALLATSAGDSVVGLDANPAVVAQLNSGRSHIDDVSDAELSAAIEKGYRASSDRRVLAGADTVLVCVPTPLAEEGGPDLGAVIDAGTAIGEHVRPGTLVILESTTYPGTTKEVFAPLVWSRLSPEEIAVAFSPERIDPGNPTFGPRNTPKIVGGLTPDATRRAREFYEQFIDVVIEAKGAGEAEMAKLLENTFRHVNIALVNEMVRFCRELDIDLWNAIDCAETKPFGFMAFRPGPGVGGHCIPVDPVYLSHRVKAKLGYAFRMVELAEEINHAAPRYVAERVWQLLNERGQAVNGARILLVGVTYKPDVADRRESPADPLALLLAKWGADVRYIDPFVPTWHVTGDGIVLTLESESDLLQAAEGADLVVLLQPHRRLPLAALPDVPVPVLDTRGILDLGSEVTRL